MTEREPDWDTAAEQEAEARRDHAARFDTDPDALAWARERVLEVTARWRTYGEHAAATGMPGNAEKWQRIANLTENDLIGGKTDHYGAFDHRHAETTTGEDRSK